MTEQKKIWTVKEILTWISARFHAEGISSSLLDAQLLLCHVLNFQNRIDLYTKSDMKLKENELKTLRGFVQRRLAREPVAYIINQKYWHHLDLYINSHVLVPRPETESLVDFVFESSTSINLEPKNIFDFCTGSGCIAIAFAKLFPNAKVFAFDISGEALEVAKKNALRNKISNVEFIQGDVTEASFFQMLKSNFGNADIITANPPYVASEHWNTLEPEIVKYEPKNALICEDSGLFIGRAIFDGVQKHELLNEKSVFCMELDHKQPQVLLALVESTKIDTPSHVHGETKIISLKTQHHEKPLNQWCVLKDFENKERFLVKLSE